MEEHDRILREGYARPSVASTTSSPSSTSQRKTSVGVSDGSSSSNSSPCPSISLFLRNVRASFEARQARENQADAYDIFVDERERGFLGEFGDWLV